VNHVSGLTVLALVAGVPAVSWGQDYPARPVRIIVGFPPGGVTDLVARILGQKLSENLGQQFVVDNRPGASSVIASDITAKATRMATPCGSTSCDQRGTARSCRTIR
jgi:tripartite-type tricarboxylate transporter receptor subunit TctC